MFSNVILAYGRLRNEKNRQSEVIFGIGYVILVFFFRALVILAECRLGFVRLVHTLQESHREKRQSVFKTDKHPRGSHLASLHQAASPKFAE